MALVKDPSKTSIRFKYLIRNKFSLFEWITSTKYTVVTHETTMMNWIHFNLVQCRTYTECNIYRAATWKQLIRSVPHERSMWSYSLFVCLALYRYMYHGVLCIYNMYYATCKVLLLWENSCYLLSVSLVLIVVDLLRVSVLHCSSTGTIIFRAALYNRLHVK